MIRELIVEICSHLDHRSILSLLSVNRFIASTGDDETFWRRLLPLQVTLYRPEGLSYRRQFIDVMNVDKGWSGERIDLLIASGAPLDERVANRAIVEGHEATLDLLRDRNVFPSPNCIYDVIIADRPESLFWLQTTGRFYGTPIIWMNTALINMSEKVLDALAERGFSPRRDYIERALTSYNERRVSWLTKNGLL